MVDPRTTNQSPPLHPAGQPTRLLILPLMLSPWSTIIGAPDGSSVRAHGRMIVDGMPLSRTTSSPFIS